MMGIGISKEPSLSSSRKNSLLGSSTAGRVRKSYWRLTEACNQPCLMATEATMMAARLYNIER